MTYHDLVILVSRPRQLNATEFDESISKVGLNFVLYGTAHKAFILSHAIFHDTILTSVISNESNSKRLIIVSLRMSTNKIPSCTFVHFSVTTD